VSNTKKFDQAVAVLKSHYQRLLLRPPELQEASSIGDAKQEVLGRYQQLFSLENIKNITEEDFRQFLIFKNNRHWISLQRMGPSICRNMDTLRKALNILLDESKSINDRLSKLVPKGGPAYVPMLSKAVLTPILLISHPDKYGVWNQISEGEMKVLGVWPEFERKLPFGEKYTLVNSVLLKVAKAVGVDLWTLDTLWWVNGQGRSGIKTPNSEREDEQDEDTTTPKDSSTRFGLERHLHEFLRDNWEHTELGKEWKLYEEDGDPEAGYEYPCDVGRIDLLAHHRTEPRWLIIELKRSQSSDQTVGQVLRYMGWVRSKMADKDEDVQGLIIAHASDKNIAYALSVTSDISLQLYEVDFRLKAAAGI